VIDLHLHTTASDGLLSPAALVARAASVGLTVIAVTDHDTVAGLPEAADAAAAHGLRLVTGIEITAVEREKDVHVLGYFFDPGHPQLTEFLARQRADRARRLRDLLERLATLGLAIDAAALTVAAATDMRRTIGRPQIADALVAAGHARDRSDAFDRWLAEGRPGYVPRQGSPGAAVVALLDRAGGLASLAHPGLLRMDVVVEEAAAAGLRALEVRHSEHDGKTERRYREMAARLGLACSGGSDFHGDRVHHDRSLGTVTLPPEDFAALESAAA